MAVHRMGHQTEERVHIVLVVLFAHLAKHSFAHTNRLLLIAKQPVCFRRHNRQAHSWSATKLYHLLWSEIACWIGHNPLWCRMCPGPSTKRADHIRSAGFPISPKGKLFRMSNITNPDALSLQIIALYFILAGSSSNSKASAPRVSNICGSSPVLAGGAGRGLLASTHSLQTNVLASSIAQAGEPRAWRSFTKLWNEACPEARCTLIIMCFTASSFFPVGASSRFNFVRESA